MMRNKTTTTTTKEHNNKQEIYKKKKIATEVISCHDLNLRIFKFENHFVFVV